MGHPDAGARHAATAQALEVDPRYEPFSEGFSRAWEATAHLHAGRSEGAIEIYAELGARPGASRVYGCWGQTMVLAMVGRTDECAGIAEDAVNAARDLANPYFLAKALYGLGLAGCLRVTRAPALATST